MSPAGESNVLTGKWNEDFDFAIQEDFYYLYYNLTIYLVIDLL